MSELTIKEDCSPYYIKFTHNEIDQVISYCLDFSYLWHPTQEIQGFVHHVFHPYIGQKILNIIPMSKKINFDVNRVSLFITRPGFYYTPHKDGGVVTAGINYIIEVKDNNCKTSWYDDEQLAPWPIDSEMQRKHISREPINFLPDDKDLLIPKCSTVFNTGDCVLFNTDIFHDFDNRKSTNTRVILTLRSKGLQQLAFDEWKTILFQ